MSKIKLFSFVHKVRGERNWVLEDLLQNRLFHIDPNQGDAAALKKDLVDSGLAYHTDGEPEAKFTYDVDKYEDYMHLRKLFIRISNECSSACDDCGEYCLCYRDPKRTMGRMESQIIQNLIDQIQGIPIDSLIITGGNPLTCVDSLQTIREGIPAKEAILLFRKPDSTDKGYRTASDLGYRVVSEPLIYSPVAVEKMQIDPFSFFYSQKFDLCLGHSLAVDIDGSVKPCLWHPDNLGNINSFDLKKMVQSSSFRQYWELHKDKFDKCRGCEFRYACRSCQAQACRQSVGKDTVPLCSYDPITGEWGRES